MLLPLPHPHHDEMLRDSARVGTTAPPAAGRMSVAARTIHRRRRSVTWLSIAVLLPALVSPAAAMRRCGDDTNGHGKAVRCRCGDMLVSSRTLTAADRVTRGSCPGTGLLVAAAGPVTLALNGRTIRGDGQGVGILVVRGTLSLQGPGGVEGFETGVMARGQNALRDVIGVRVAQNRLDGLFADGDGYSVQGSAAEGNGRDGFALGGSAYAVDGSRAAGNHRYGFSLWGMGGHVGGGLGNQATGNGMSGFYLRGMMHEIVGATALENGGDGLFAAVMHTLLADVHADRNLRDGVQAMGMAIAVAASSADDNRGFGIWVNGMALDDRGGNHGAGNGGLVGLAPRPSLMMTQMMPALVQCRVGMMTECR